MVVQTWHSEASVFCYKFSFWENFAHRLLCNVAHILSDHFDTFL
jgi:hypothetical protein